MRRGEVWWGGARTRGPEQKRRPFLVVSRDSFNADGRYEKALVVHLTTVRHPAGPFDWEVEIPRGTASLPASSIAKCNEIYTVWKTELDSQLGKLPASLMEQVDRALALVLALPMPAVAND